MVTFNDPGPIIRSVGIVGFGSCLGLMACGLPGVEKLVRHLSKSRFAPNAEPVCVFGYWQVEYQELSGLHVTPNI